MARARPTWRARGRKFRGPGRPFRHGQLPTLPMHMLFRWPRCTAARQGGAVTPDRDFPLLVPVLLDGGSKNCHLDLMVTRRYALGGRVNEGLRAASAEGEIAGRGDYRFLIASNQAARA